MPDFDCAVFRSRDDDGELGVIYGETDVRSMTFECRNQRFCCVVPNLDCPIIGGCKEIWLVRLGVVVNEVNTLGLVRLERKVGSRAAEGPYLDGTVETRGGECVGVFGIYRDAHNVVLVASELLYACYLSAYAMSFGMTTPHTLPRLVPVPKLYSHVILKPHQLRFCVVQICYPHWR